LKLTAKVSGKILLSAVSAPVTLIINEPIAKLSIIARLPTRLQKAAIAEFDIQKRGLQNTFDA